MNFQEALQLMKKGKKVRRKVWTKYNDAPKYFYLGKKNIHNQNKISARLCSTHSLEANDWEEVYEEEELNEKLEETLDSQFPKGDKARGRALVLFAVAQMELNKLKRKRK